MTKHSMSAYIMGKLQSLPEYNEALLIPLLNLLHKFCSRENVNESETIKTVAILLFAEHLFNINSSQIINENFKNRNFLDFNNAQDLIESYKQNRYGNDNPLEIMIILDIIMLNQMGAIKIFRILTEHKNENIFELVNIIENSYKKAIEMQNLFKTKSGFEYAQGRIDFMKKIISEFREEIMVYYGINKDPNG